MPDIEAVVAEQRARLQRQVEGPLVRALAADYARALTTIEARVAKASTLAARRIANGQDPFASLLERKRLNELANQVGDEMRAISERNISRIEEIRRPVVVAALRDVQAMGQAMEIAVRLDTGAVERIVSAFEAKSPLRSLKGIHGETQTAVRNALVKGVTLGDNPRVTARAVAKAIGNDLNRALTISRTETLRAYRGATQDTYRRNRNIVEGWVWISARDRRTCGMCFGMHGTNHDLDEVFGSHPNCRCSAAPLPRTAAPELRAQVPSGEERFAELKAADQRAVLGPAKLAAYNSGQLRLADLVGSRIDPKWGRVRYERSLSSILGARADQYYRRAA